MPQKFLSIKNFEKYQHYKQRNPPWIKLHKSLLGDRDFMNLSIPSRYLYIGLLILCSETDNKVCNDPSWIAQRLSVPISEIDLKPLYRSGFLLASTTSIWRYHQSEESRDREEERIVGASLPSPKVNGTHRGTIYPENFEPDERAHTLAKSYGLNVYKEQAAFRDHHAAKGSIFKDWQAAFRTWLRNSVKFAQKGAR
jgi:hypothetical protein